MSFIKKGFTFFTFTGVVLLDPIHQLLRCNSVMNPERLSTDCKLL